MPQLTSDDQLQRQGAQGALEAMNVCNKLRCLRRRSTGERAPNHIQLNGAVISLFDAVESQPPVLRRCYYPTSLALGLISTRAPALPLALSLEDISCNGRMPLSAEYA